MSTVSYVMLTHKNEYNYTGEAFRGDASFGSSDGLHTVSARVTNFVGRLYIEATLASTPAETDWFPVFLTSGANYYQFPQNSVATIEDLSVGRGESATVGFSFRVNAMFLRARVDRSYHPGYNEDTGFSTAQWGGVEEVLLNV